MLSTPPAFILSQDQTLRSKAASPPPTDHVSVILFLKLSVGAPRPLTGKKVELALSNVRLTSEKTYCPSLEFHPQYPVVKVPREASRPAALASGARRYFTGFPVGCQRPFSKFLKIRFQREPASTGSEEPATAPSSSAELVEYSLGSKSARGNLENFLNDISTTLATRVTRKLPLPHHAKPPPANRISQKPGVLIWQNICPLKQKSTLSGVNHYSRNHFVAQVRPRKSARIRQVPASVLKGG